ncbi:unnamed protein product [Caenorhabditis bovis]|uniref:Uncharacterized protein n=1 Tax=Caenorhabditis bovis TaxID=2654633 RepID=A0A8S1EC49_9PELO|nr:unnamed protein product [Caenorhabditis bovis]
MRAEMGSVPLMCIFSMLTNSVLTYLPNEDLTNSLPNSILPGGGFPTESIPFIPSGEEEETGSQEDEDADSVYRKKATKFRRRNINGPFGGRIPFSRMAYKTGYGSNRFGGSRMGGGGFFERERNPYGTVTIGGNGAYGPYPDEVYNMRPSPPYSGLIGGSRNGYYGSSIGVRRQTLSNRKPSPDFLPDFPANDLVGSFNNNNQALPSLRELATYASRYGPAYLRERFGSSDERPNHPFPGSQVAFPRGGGGHTDFGLNIATNNWNGIGGKLGYISRDPDSYQHDATPSTTTAPTKTKIPKKKAKASKSKNAGTPKPSAKTTPNPKKLN